jgi:hypothetical protein
MNCAQSFPHLRTSSAEQVRKCGNPLPHRTSIGVWGAVRKSAAASEVRKTTLALTIRVQPNVSSIGKPRARMKGSRLSEKGSMTLMFKPAHRGNQPGPSADD